MKPAVATMLILALLAAAPSHAEDWPMLGRDGTRNSVSSEAGAPTNWAIDSLEQSRRIPESRGVLWSATLGPSTFSSPIVSGGLVWIGTTQEHGDASVLKCFRASDGAEVYEYESAYLGKREYDTPWGGLGSSPLVEGDRLWLATNRSEVLCLDIGPLIRGLGKPRELWKLDFVKEFRTYPRVPLMGPPRPCSIGASWQDRLFVTIPHGISYGKTKVENPDAPSLVCLDKNTGAVIWQDNSPGENILSSQFSSPTLATIDGQVQVIVPQSDGWVRAFDPLDGTILWEFDMNPKVSVFKYVPSKRQVSRCCVLGNAVVYRDLVYVATGMEVEHAVGPGRLVCIDPSKRGDISSELAVDVNGQSLPRRRLQAVDGTAGEKAIPNPNSALVWEFTNFKSDDIDPFQLTISSVAVAQELVIAADYYGVVHCFDAGTGERHWTYDVFAEIWATPLIVDDKIYIADSDGDVTIFGLSADPRIALQTGNGLTNPLHTNSFYESINSSPIFANGVLYVARTDRLFAITGGSELAASQRIGGDWPQWRGPNRDNKSTETGLLHAWPEGGPPLVREVGGIGTGIGSLAVGGGNVYSLGYIGESEYVNALDEFTGQREWCTPIGPKVDEATSMRWLSQRTPTLDEKRLYAFTSHGVLICLSTANGKELWRSSYIEKFGTPLHPWGLCDYPLVDGDRLICAPGGSDATMVALNKYTGEEIWRSKFEATDDWSGMIVSNATGIRQYVLFLGKKLCGVAADDGKLLWTNEVVAMPRNYTTPIIQEDLVFSSTTTGGGGGGIGLLKLSAQENGIQAGLEYFHSRPTPNAFSDSAVFNASQVFMLSNGVPTCLDLKTGQVVWQKRIADGSRHDGWVFADGQLYLRQARGSMRLIEASSQGFVEKGSFPLPDVKPSLGATMPVIAGGHLYVRDDDRLLCYDVRRTTSKDSIATAEKIQLAVPTARTSDQPRVVRSVFVPTPEAVVTKMLELANVKPSDVVYDLGSGDGRIVIAAARQYGCRAFGYEIDTNLVRLSRAAVQEAELEKLVTIHQSDMLTADLQEADVVTLYLVPDQLAALLPQLQKLKPGTRVVSHQFEIPGIEPGKATEFDSNSPGEQHTVYLWTAPLRSAN